MFGYWLWKGSRCIRCLRKYGNKLRRPVYKRRSLKSAEVAPHAVKAIAEIGVTINAKRSISVLKWELFKKVKRKDDFVMLYQENNWYNVFPRRFFASTSDWGTFLDLVETHLSTSSS
jgi:hypothetical protein